MIGGTSFKVTFWIAVDNSLDLKQDDPDVSLTVKYENSTYHLEKTQAARLSLLIRDFLKDNQSRTLVLRRGGLKGEDKDAVDIPIPHDKFTDHEIFDKFMELLSGKYDVEIPIKKLVPFGELLAFFKLDLSNSLRGQALGDAISDSLSAFFLKEHLLDIYIFAKMLNLPDLRECVENSCIAEAREIIAPIRSPRLSEKDVLDLLGVHLKRREEALGEEAKKPFLQNWEIKAIIDSYYPFKIGDDEYHKRRLDILKSVTHYNLDSYVEWDSRFQFEMLKEENLYLERKILPKTLGDVSKIIGHALCNSDPLDVKRTNSFVNLFEYRPKAVDALSFKVDYGKKNLGLRSVTVFRPYLGSISTTIFSLIEGNSCNGNVLRKFPVDMKPIKGIYESVVKFDFPVAIVSDQVYTMSLYYDEVSLDEKTYSKAGTKCSEERLINDLVVKFLPAKDIPVDNNTSPTFGQFLSLEFVVYDEVEKLEKEFYLYSNQIY